MDCWILNDSPNPVSAGSLKAYIQIVKDKIFIGQMNYPILSPNQNFIGSTLNFQLICAKSGFMKLILEIEDCSEMDSEYTLLYKADKC